MDRRPSELHVLKIMKLLARQNIAERARIGLRGCSACNDFIGEAKQYSLAASEHDISLDGLYRVALCGPLSRLNLDAVSARLKLYRFGSATGRGHNHAVVMFAMHACSPEWSSAQTLLIHQN